MRSVRVPTNVRCYSNSAIIIRRSAVTLRADTVAKEKPRNIPRGYVIGRSDGSGDQRVRTKADTAALVRVLSGTLSVVGDNHNCRRAAGTDRRLVVPSIVLGGGKRRAVGMGRG